MLSNGQDIRCTLRECLDPLKGLESAGQGPENRTFQHQVRTLVSFHMWACQSVQDRDRFLESAHDRQVTVQAAVLRSARHLMVQKIKNKSLSSQSQVVQEHVQDGAYVLTHDPSTHQNNYGKSRPSINDHNECEVIYETANEMEKMIMDEKSRENGMNEKGNWKRGEDERSVGGCGGDVSRLNKMMIQDWRCRNGSERNDVTGVGSDRDKDEDRVRERDRHKGINIDRGRWRDREGERSCTTGRGMDIERVLRACHEAVQSNNTSLQCMKDAQKC